VGALVDAKRCMASAWRILDGTDGAASGVEPALNAVLAGIDAIYAIEHVNAYNADVASPAKASARHAAPLRWFAARRPELAGLANRHRRASQCRNQQEMNAICALPRRIGARREAAELQDFRRC